jgi:hypothetical protein
VRGGECRDKARLYANDKGQRQLLREATLQLEARNRQRSRVNVLHRNRQAIGGEVTHQYAACDYNFEQMAFGKKTFDILPLSDGVKEGDTIEYGEHSFSLLNNFPITGRKIIVEVTFVLDRVEGIDPRYAIVSFKVVKKISADGTEIK